MVLFDKIHNIISEPRHVFAHDEGEVARVYFFIVYYGLDLITSPSSIYHISQGVLLTCEYSNGHSDILKRDFVRMALL